MHPNRLGASLIDASVGNETQFLTLGPQGQAHLLKLSAQLALPIFSNQLKSFVVRVIAKNPELRVLEAHQFRLFAEYHRPLAAYHRQRPRDEATAHGHKAFR